MPPVQFCSFLTVLIFWCEWSAEVYEAPFISLPGDQGLWLAGLFMFGKRWLSGTTFLPFVALTAYITWSEVCCRSHFVSSRLLFPSVTLRWGFGLLCIVVVVGWGSLPQPLSCFNPYSTHLTSNTIDLRRCCPDPMYLSSQKIKIKSAV